MPEGVVDSLTSTFPMPRESESASRLRAIISDMLPIFTDDYADDGTLSEYITVIVCNGKSQSQARYYLEAFLGEQSGKFVACLWELLSKDFSQGKQENPGSEPLPKNEVDCGSHDTLIEQGLGSRRDNDYDHKATNATYLMNEKLTSGTTAREDAETRPEVSNMRMLRQELINSPCKRSQVPKEKDDSGVNYSRKVLRSVVVSATKQPCGVNPDRYEKSMDARRGRSLQRRLYFPEREMKPHVSVWDRLGRPGDKETPTRPKFRIQEDENKVFQQYGQRSETFQREEVPADSYRQQYQKARKPEGGLITYTEPHITHNLGRKRRYGSINPYSIEASAGEFSSVPQHKKAKQDVEKPSLLSSYQSAKQHLFTEILNMKQKMQQLENQINQAKQLKKQKVGELKRSPQSGELQHQEDVTESKIVHVTNVHYAAKKEAISMLFSKCGTVENVTVVTDPVTGHPKGAAIVTFATKESVNKAIAMSNTMFYSRPIKVRFDTSLSRILEPYYSVSDTTKSLTTFQLSSLSLPPQLQADSQPPENMDALQGYHPSNES
ncbi:unnamed protein product [Thlaspi arvense]|uniref:RRM domain-containing protein n=1 Tax=Thlaspi arvense TaxID=13288 RepID=A0AAU9SFB1_THLAR|nr:unnamed protein product [Thlaspi arvense]